MLIKTISTPALRSLSSKVAIVPAKPLVEAELISGVPPEITRRPVRIYKPTKTAMQSGTAETMYWRLDFDAQQQWSNPLMGWASTADPVHSLRIKFSEKKQAIAFAERQGYDYWVEEPKPEKFKPKMYASNFKYSSGPLKYHHTK